MKKICPALLIVMLTAATAFGAQHTISAGITEATVYFDQARITRQASASVEAGTHRLLVGVDAFSLDPDSVTAEIRGEGRILGVQVSRMPVSRSPREKIRELEARRDALLEKQQEIKDEKTALKRQEAFLDSVVDFSKTQVPREIKTQMPSLDELNATRDFLGKQYSRVLSLQRDAEKKLSETGKQIDQVQRELEMLRSSPDKTASAIEILFDAKTAQTIAVKAQYIVKNAGWSPVYRATAADVSKGVDLFMMAQVSQQTGEDWKDVNLSISTATPVAGGRLPGLSPWFLDHDQLVHRKSAPAGAGRMEQMALRADDRAAAPMAEAEKHTTAVSFEYTLPMPVSVASRQEKTLLPVFTRNLDGLFYHLAVPRINPEAYLVCEAAADSELLAGPVQVFFEGRYVGRMFLGRQPPGEPFVLGLGLDRSVAVKREKIRDHRKETAFFGKIERDTVVREIEYRIAVENLKDRPVALRVRDSIPVSRTDRIEVKDIVFSPEPKDRDFQDKPGVMQWQMDLEPGTSRQISISFTVTYPKDMPQPVF
jgi:uncharacterized protein (TIGR02231 family)